MRTLWKRLAASVILACGALVALAPTAFACGGLIAPDGDVRLDKAATLIAWHDGIEHYLTSFAYTEPNQTGSASGSNTTTNVGWIVPLPAVPLKIEDGGAWTLQRLERETLPPPSSTVEFGATTAAPSAAQVLQQVQVEALDVTIVRGSGPAIVAWAQSNGFFINDETASHLGIYAKGSPIFMAAKYNAAIAKQRGQISGDGVPLLITMKTAHPWVPLEVLALDGQQVNADLYFLTDEPLNVSDFNAVVGESAVGQTVPNAPGMTVAFQEKVTPQLYHDLSTDRNMGWVWPDSWFTYVSLNAPDTSVTYDLGISPRGVIRVAPFGTAPMAVVDGVEHSAPPAWMPSLPLGTPEYALGALLLLIVVGLIVWMARGRGKQLAQASDWKRDQAGPKLQKSL
jgi:hypothetical protein